MVPPVSHRVSRVRRYSGIRLMSISFRLRVSHPLWMAFPYHSTNLAHRCDAPQPRSYCYNRFGLFRVRSPLLAESLLMSLPRPTSMFQFRRFPSYPYLIQGRILEYCSSGFPHSEIPGSKSVCDSPRLIAASHVLLRLLVPRHSPCALISLTFCKSVLEY